MNSIKNLTDHLEKIAPLAYQESYDNSGLIIGNPSAEIKGVLICLDSTEEIVDEAIKNNCNLIIAHHPIVFSGLKKITGRNYVERTVLKAIKNDIAIYAIHTNLDNVSGGVNSMICDKLGLKNVRILSPKTGLLKKLVTFVPFENAEKVKNALFASGAGEIGNYSECSFNAKGEGTFKGNDSSDPHVGKKGERHTEPEIRIEVIFEARNQSSILKALIESHPYEEVAFDIYSLDNTYSKIGSGMIGELPESQEKMDFLVFVKKVMNAGMIRYTSSEKRKIQKVAVCGGSGSFLLQDAIRMGAEAFITADFKYHQFFDAEGKLVIIDIGHYESEQFTMELIKTLILEKFSTFAVRLTEVNTNPVKYL